MKRQDIVDRLLKEGFSQKTLMNFTDKELTTLSSRLLGEAEVMISKTDPMLKQKVDTAKKEKKTIETYEGKELKGGQKKIDKNHNGKIDSQDFKILRNKKSEVKEELKGDQEKIDKNKNGKIDSEDFKILKNKKSEVKEEKPSAGLSKEKKSEVVKSAKKGEDIGKKGKGFKEVEKSAKKSGAKDPKAVAAAAMWKNIKKESVEPKKDIEVSEWVERLAESKYHSFTSKSEIMEMIKNKLDEQEVGENVTKGHNDIPEFMSSKSLLSLKGGDVEVKPSPVKTPTEKPNPVKDPFRPRPGKERKPKARIAENKDTKK